MSDSSQPLAVVTGASTGIGYELAKIAAEKGYALVICADEPGIQDAAARLGGKAEPVQADLATTEGVDELLQKIGNRQISVLCANAGRGLGRAFTDQDWADIRNVIDTNVTGTTYLLHKALNMMARHNTGRILVTGSIAGLMPGTYQAVYNGTKAYLDSLSEALRAELKSQGSNISVTCLMPGPTETEFFKRADMMDTSVGTAKKDDAAMVAETGWEAMM
ncbi:MAG: SDR family NAD(P)-dependent oxidoreductase, partial [Acetobacteraceae bacterium]|nr:SDR family NAD(P)-dependent oxidoreductase [Acetobacteraceae bacterium]